MEREHPMREAFTSAENDEAKAKEEKSQAEEDAKSINPTRKISGAIKVSRSDKEMAAAERLKKSVVFEAHEQAEKFNIFLDWLSVNQDKFKEWATENYGSVESWKRLVIEAADYEGDYDDTDEVNADLLTFVKNHQNKLLSWASKTAGIRLGSIESLIEWVEHSKPRKTNRQSDGSDFVARDNYDRRVRQDNNY